ncbi:divalent cation transporter [Pseudomonas benzenivorans]|uniref:Divalent cation transporter n=1 Tax=Pseudomonas benzenivorans TaxID=556533 RepID=A0ABZ0PS66_9PSED|nr:divalent cation transporter [Pseudomonas benzenivorans]WPC03741.1 divalent cation transporter [Pseudomonas benzenivorans]
MPQLLTVVLFTLLAGMAMPCGAALASVGRISPGWLEEEFRHGVMAFGGGALLAAVALVLVPEAIDDLSPGWVVLYFSAGGAAFMGVDVLMFRLRTSASQLLAMLADFIPESLALGAAFAFGGEGAVLLALLMALQNLPEGFNAYRELSDATAYSRRQIILTFAAMALLGPLAGVSGYLWLADSPVLVAAIMLFAAGGILYSVFQDIAPQAKLDKHWAPSLGALLGFVLGIIGHMATVA